MTAVYGITDAGFIKETLAEIISGYQEAYKVAFGDDCNFIAPSNMSITIGIASEREAKIWDLAEEAWNARVRSTAQGVSLDNDMELTASQRLPALQSVGVLTLFGDVGTVVGTGLIVAASSNSLALFSPTAASLPLVAGADEVQLISFSAVPTSGVWSISLGTGTTDDMVFNANAAAVQAEINAIEGFETATVTGDYTSGFTVTYTGLSCGLQPWPLLAVVDDTLLATATPVTLLVTETTLGVIQGSVPIASIALAPVVGLAGTITVINTPITGLSRVKNLLDVTVGRFVETDAEARIRTADELANTGKTTVEAIRTDLLGVPGVIDAIVIQNTTLTVDGNGNPGKSIHAYVDGGDPQDIANMLWASTAGGIQTDGTIVNTVVDSQGLPQTISFDRPIPKNIYMIVTITKNASTWPADGVAEILTAAGAYGASLRTGDPVLVYPKLLPFLADAVAGMTNIGIKVGLAATPTLDANIIQAVNERAYFDSSRIIVNVS